MIQCWRIYCLFDNKMKWVSFNIWQDPSFVEDPWRGNFSISYSISRIERKLEMKANIKIKYSLRVLGFSMKKMMMDSDDEKKKRNNAKRLRKKGEPEKVFLCLLINLFALFFLPSSSPPCRPITIIIIVRERWNVIGIWP